VEFAIEEGYGLATSKRKVNNPMSKEGKEGDELDRGDTKEGNYIFQKEYKNNYLRYFCEIQKF
jgi:hypothetical protein